MNFESDVKNATVERSRRCSPAVPRILRNSIAPSHPSMICFRSQPFAAGAAPAYVDYIVFGTLQMPRRLNDVDPLSAQQDAILRWRDAMRGVYLTDWRTAYPEMVA